VGDKPSTKRYFVAFKQLRQRCRFGFKVKQSSGKIANGGVAAMVNNLFKSL